MHSVRFQSALVLGLGASGAAAARLLRDEGARVTVVDAGDTGVLRERAAALRARGVEVCLAEPGVPAGAWEVGIVSPGIAAGAPSVRAARVRGLPLLSELELGWSRARGPVLAVTGSNGKSTLVKLCAEALARAGKRAVLAGNYGPAVCEVVREPGAWDWLVLEVSSFQLETVSALRPEVGVLLNLVPNHLDRHGDLDTYRALKARLFARMRATDTAVVPAGTCDAIRAVAGSSPRWVTFGTEAAATYRYQPARVEGPAGYRAEMAGTGFDSEILGVAAAAAAAALTACGAGPGALAAAARAFVPLPHRMQVLGRWNGVRVVDDSKATNLAALVAAVRMTPGPVRLIAGGRPKGESWAAGRSVLADRVAGAYLIGEAAAAMAAAWSETVPCVLCETLAAAVAAAWRAAQPGDTILLSPGCASFDQFAGFAERGMAFQHAVANRV